MKLILGLLVLLFPTFALAQMVPNPDENLGEFVSILISAFQGGNWFLVGVLVISLATWFLGKWVKSPDWLPIIAAATGMLSSLATGALGSTLPWYQELTMGLLTGGGSALFWSLLLKRFLPSRVKVPEPEPVVDKKEG